MPKDEHKRNVRPVGPNHSAQTNPKAKAKSGKTQQSPQMIGPFRLEEELGAGGMGVVYRATYTKTGQQVALKVLPDSLSQNEKLVARFEREMAILQKLHHPNIVPYYGGWKYKGKHFYAMKLMPRGSVEQILRKQKRLPWRQVVDYAIDVCRALEHAHSHHVVHRDLKPANLFLADDGRVCLGDFGIARDMDATALTAAGFTVGTYAYMAPEQITGKQPITHRTDLYALGCVMFEMLTGHTPYRGESQAEILFQHVQADIPRVREIVEDCPVELERLIRQLLEKDPDKRPWDAAHVLHTLKEIKRKATAKARAQTQDGHAQTIEDLHPELTKIAGVKKDNKEAQKKKKKKKKRKKQEADDTPFYERVWFLATCLVVLVGVVAWTLRPASEEELFQQAQALMESKDPAKWLDAKNQLLKLKERFPNGRYAQQVQDYLDQIEMYQAERRAITDARLGKEPKSEAERHFIEAWRFEQFGDRVSALERYRGLIELFKDVPDAKAYVNLAKKRIAEIEAQGEAGEDRTEIVNRALERADKLYSEGKTIQAHKIWDSIVTLYSGNREFEPQVRKARERLTGKSLPKDSSDAARNKDSSDAAQNDESTSSTKSPADAP